MKALVRHGKEDIRGTVSDLAIDPMMKMLTNLSRLFRFPSAPVIERKAQSSPIGADRLARALGWFSLGLGLVELLAPRSITLKLGMRGKETLVRGFGLREMLAGFLTLAVDKRAGLLTRIAGDGLDLAVLGRACRRVNRRHGNATTAAAIIGAITVLDIVATLALTRTPASRAR